MSWWLVTILGPIILGAVIAYALITRRQLTPTEKAAQNRAIERAYKTDEPDG